MNDYARAPNQPLLTTSSPTFAGLTINGAATFASTVTATGQFLAGDGTDGAPSYAFASAPTYGMRFNPLTGTVFIHGGGESWGTKTGQLALPSSSSIVWTNGALSAAGDLYLARLAAASIRVGAAPSATPVAQVFTIGEASRPGTDTNVGGASGTFRSGLGTGTGTASSLIFQTPDLVASGSTTQTYSTRLTVATAVITATVPVFASASSGYDFQAGQANAFRADAAGFGLIASGINLGNGVGIQFSSTANWYDTIDLSLARLAAASLRLGAAPSATPINQTFTIGEASRAGTDSDVGGANGTFRSGLGTGTGTPSALIFQTPTAAASGSGAQTYTTRLTLGENATFTGAILLSAGQFIRWGATDGCISVSGEVYDFRRSDVGTVRATLGVDYFNIADAAGGYKIAGTKVVGARVTGVAVDLAAIHAALVTHGLISA